MEVSLPTGVAGPGSAPELDFEVRDAGVLDHAAAPTLRFGLGIAAVAGPTESLLELDAWEELERDNPVLRTLEPDVEALLVNRARGAEREVIVPIEDPYRLVALIRTRWRGLTGGREVWEEIDAFFDDLAERAKTTTDAREEAAWQTT